MPSERVPEVIHVPLIEDEDLVDTATLRDAKPLGVLRVTAAGSKEGQLFS